MVRRTVDVVDIDALPHAYSGLTRFDMVTDRHADEFRTPLLPDDVGTVHAEYRSATLTRYRPVREVEFYTSPTSYRRAWCGADVKVVLPVAFDVGDDDACQACVSALLSGEPVRRPARWVDDGWTDDADEDAV